MALNKQIWIDQIKENFYPDTSFLKYATDMSGLVENDKINLAEAGLDPDVLINNTAYPIPISVRIDSLKTIDLDTFETKNTLIRRPEVIEYSYDQLESVLRGHKNSLRTSTATKAAHSIAPQQDTTFTPIIVTTGAVAPDGKRAITISDVITLKKRFDQAEIPLEKRHLVLNPSHVADLLKEDMTIFKDVSNYVDGKMFKFAGFNMLEFSRMPLFDSTTIQKKAYGSAPAPSDSICSFAFQSDEVMKADGDVYLYSQIDAPGERGTTVGFDKRFICMPFRDKGIGAIVSGV